MLLKNLLPYTFFDWCESTPLGDAVKQAMWSFAIVETVHIVALAVLMGSMVVIDLRFLGGGLKRMPTVEVAGLLRPWFWAACFVMVASGVCLFLAEAVRLSGSAPFAYKMALVLVAVAVHLTIHRRAIASATDGAALGRAAAGLSLTCWLGIALAGRAIAFL